MSKYEDYRSTTNETAGKPLTITELAEMYSISLKTMRRWLKPHEDRIGKREGRYYTTLQVRTIFNCLGAPGEIV